MKKIKIKIQLFFVRTLRRIQMLFANPSERRHALVGRPQVWRMKREFQINFLRSVGLKPRHYLLDIGCGTLRGGLPIIKYLENKHYVGLEVRPEVLEEARRELKEADIEKDACLIMIDDILLFEPERKYDFMWAYSVLIHLSDNILGDMLEFVRANLKETGFFYANVNLAERKDSYWHQGFPLVWRPIEFYQQEASKAGLDVMDMGTVKMLGFGTGLRDHDQHHILKFSIKNEGL